MMNLIAITLIATSLGVSGFLSPTPKNKIGDDQVITKEGHRAVVVEYAADTAGDGNTKVSISPPQTTTNGPIEDQLSRAAASVTGVAQDVKGKTVEALSAPHMPYGARPRELICDAFGKCKHKIAGAWSKAKEKAVEAEEEVKEVVDKAKDLDLRATRKGEERTEDVPENAKEKVKEMVGEKARQTGETVRETADIVVDKAKEVGSRVAREAEERTEGVRENAKEKVKKAGEAAERVKEKAKQTGEMAQETAGKVKEKTGEMARETAEKLKGKTGEIAEETGEKIKQRSRKGKKELSNFAKRGKEVVFDAIRYVFRPESMASLMGIIQIMGFAMAYGISIWVTFIMSHVLAWVLPRQQFGMVQSKIYPVYFKAMVGSIGLALLGHLMGQRGKVFKNKADMLQGFNLISSVLLVLGNLLLLEPRTTKVMLERMKLEKEEGRGRGSPPSRVIDTVMSGAAGPTPVTATSPTTSSGVAATTSPLEQDEATSKLGNLDSRLRKLNSYSSILNIMSLMGLTWHLVYLSQRLGLGCS